MDVAYIYDAWNRLVAVEYDEVERARYDYNGLSWRIAKTAYMVEATAFWQKRLMYYNHNWQLLEEHIDDDFDDQEGFDPNRHMQYVWGVRYIDDIVLRRQDSNLDDTLDKTWYHCTDTLFSTVAILDHTAKLVERVSYDAYGNARHHRMGDLNGDGAVDISDQLLLFGAWGDGGVGDLNRDGASDVSDLLLLQGSWGPAQPAGRISAGSSGTDNIIGYAGYVFNPEMHGSGLYLARNRYYDPELSRWLTRDPLGYVDGMGLYEYVQSRPVTDVDPMGLSNNLCFVTWYYHGGGRPVDLDAPGFGLGDEYRNHPVIIEQVEDGEEWLRTAADQIASAFGASIDCCSSSCFTYNYRNSRRFSIPRKGFVRNYSFGSISFWLSDWTFAIGGHMLYLDYECTIRVQCKERSPDSRVEVSYSCCTRWRMKDKFTDPLSGKELFGVPFDLRNATPFDICYQWEGDYIDG